MNTIRSRSNATARQFAQLAQSSRYRHKHRQTVLDGVHLVQAYLDRRGPPRFLLASESGLRHPEIRDLLSRPSLPEVAVLTDALFAECMGTPSPVGIAAIIALPAVPPPARLSGPTLMLEDIQDPGNLGTLLRSAAAAGFSQVLLSANCALAWAPRVLRAGMGAHFLLRLHEGMDLVSCARSFEGRVLGASPRTDAVPYWGSDLSGSLALVVGNEGAGISPALEALLQGRVAIPMQPGVESLNAAVAGSILMFERLRQQSGQS